MSGLNRSRMRASEYHESPDVTETLFLGMNGTVDSSPQLGLQSIDDVISFDVVNVPQGYWSEAKQTFQSVPNFKGFIISVGTPIDSRTRPSGGCG